MLKRTPFLNLLLLLAWMPSIGVVAAMPDVPNTAEELDAEFARTEARHAELQKQLSTLGTELLAKMTALQEVANRHAAKLGVNLIQPIPEDDPTPLPINGDVPVLKLPATIIGEASSFIWIQPETNGINVQYIALDKGLHFFPRQEMKNQRNTIVFGAPGTYRILAYTALGNLPSDPAVVEVTFGTPGPNPDPGPGPKPDPTPVVTAKNLWIVTIDNKIGRTAKMGAVLGNVPFWESLQTAGHQYEQIDTNDKEGRQTVFVAALAKANLTPPAIVFMDAATAKVIKAAPIPATTAEIQTMVNTLTGK